MTTQKMLDAIYEKYADKTLGWGCKIGRYESEYDKELKIGTFINDYVPDEYTIMYRVKTPKGIVRIDTELDLTFIGHPFSLARVLSVLGQHWSYNSGELQQFAERDYYNIIYRTLLNERGSDAILDDQSDETIQAIYNILFPKKKDD